MYVEVMMYSTPPPQGVSEKHRVVGSLLPNHDYIGARAIHRVGPSRHVWTNQCRALVQANAGILPVLKLHRLHECNYLRRFSNVTIYMYLCTYGYAHVDTAPSLLTL